MVYGRITECGGRACGHTRGVIEYWEYDERRARRATNAEFQGGKVRGARANANARGTEGRARAKTKKTKKKRTMTMTMTTTKGERCVTCA